MGWHVTDGRLWWKDIGLLMDYVWRWMPGRVPPPDPPGAAGGKAGGGRREPIPMQGRPSLAGGRSAQPVALTGALLIAAGCCS